MPEFSERDILRVCHLYHKVEKTQEEISDIIGVSRFKISRILKEAKNRGVVSITINDPWADLTDAEIELGRKFELHSAIIVKVSKLSGESPVSQVAKVGARHLEKIVKKYSILSVTWGSTIFHLVSHLRPVEVKDLALVQMAGGLGTIEGTDNNTLTVVLGQKLGAKAHLVPAPVIVQKRSIRDLLFKEKKIQESLDIARRADLVLFSVGMIGMEGLLWKRGF